MDSGTDDRSRLRLHVRAAREWLGRAEESLGRSEDVRGDLNLMLARAELMRAKETEHPQAAVVWTRRLAPLFVALLLAGGGYWAWRGVPGAQTAPPLPVERRVEAMTPLKPEEAAIPATIPLPQEIAAPVAADISEAPMSGIEADETSAMPEPDVPDAPETAEEKTQETPSLARLPSEDMQRLMNSAGQSLRAIHIEEK